MTALSPVNDVIGVFSAALAAHAEATPYTIIKSVMAAGSGVTMNYDAATGTITVSASAVGTSNVIFGTGAPASAAGSNGDYYFAIDTNAWYGPKSAGLWPATTLSIGNDFYNGGATAGTGAAYSIASPRPKVPAAGPNDNAILMFAPHTSNTSTTPTLMLSAGTARTIVSADGSALAAGDLISGHTIMAFYDTTTNTWRAAFDLSSGKAIGVKSANVIIASVAPVSTNGSDGDYWFNGLSNTWYVKAAGAWAVTTDFGSDWYNGGTTAGTGAAYTALARPLVPAAGPRDNSVVVVQIATANTSTAPTIAFNGGTARTIVDALGNALAVGDLIAGHTVLMFFDSTTSKWRASTDLSSGKTIGVNTANTLIGVAAPAAADGNNGDYWFNILTNTWYGPKASGAWPAATTNLGSDYYNAGVLAGSATAMTGAACRPLVPAAGPRDNAMLIATIGTTNTTSAPTLTLNGGTARTICRSNGTSALAVGDLVAGHVVSFHWDAANLKWCADYDLTDNLPIGGSRPFVPAPGDIGSYMYAPLDVPSGTWTVGTVKSTANLTAAGVTPPGGTGNWTVMSSYTDWYATATNANPASSLNRSVLLQRTS